MQIIGETVVAQSGRPVSFDFLALPGDRPTWVPKWGFLTSAPTFNPRFDIGGQFGGWHYGVKAYGGYGGEVGSDGEAKRGPEVNDYSWFAGVLGTGVYVAGVAGTSINHVGVYGQSEEMPGAIGGIIPEAFLGGVVGAANTRSGVVGMSGRGNGVQGFSARGDGVFGESFQGNGVTGHGVIGVAGISDPEGPTVPNTSNTAAVVGTSDRQHGVIGTSNASVGVIGFSNNIGILGYTTTPGSRAGYFLGNVQVNGTLTATVKGGVVPFPDGSQRVLYCMESPEHWFEDFGTAKLKRGRAVVKLDADFAKVIKRGDYRVFVTPEGDCRGLYVRGKSAVSFEVRELAAGKSGVAFSYRIVGRRKDIRGHRRFAKIDTRLPLPAAATRPPRKAPLSPALRAFVARMEKMTRERRPKGAKRDRRFRAFLARVEKEARARRPKGAKRGRRLRALRKRA
jgi:hypothetical protein